MHREAQRWVKVPGGTWLSPRARRRFRARIKSPSSIPCRLAAEQATRRLVTGVGGTSNKTDCIDSSTTVGVVLICSVIWTGKRSPISCTRMASSTEFTVLGANSA